MELKSKKKIINTRLLPGFTGGADAQITYKPIDFKLDTKIRHVSFQDMPAELSLPYGKKKNNILKSIGNTIADNISGIAGFAGSLYNSFSPVKGVNEIISDAGMSNQTINGVSFTQQNGIDSAAQMRELKALNDSNMINTTLLGASTGAAIAGPIGAVLGGAGGFVGSLFGSNKRKRELKRKLNEAQMKVSRTQRFNESSALTESILQQNALMYGNDEDLILYGAKDGKDLGGYLNSLLNMYDIYTSSGLQKGTPNARVAGGESIIDNIDNVDSATGSLVRSGVKDQDTELANLGTNTVVLGGQKDWRNGKTFRDQAMPYTNALEIINKKYESKSNKYKSHLSDTTARVQQEQVNKLKQPIVEKLLDLAQQQRYQHLIEGYNEQFMVKKGKDKLPKFEGGKIRLWTHAIPDIAGILASIGLYRDAASQDIKTPNVYSRNPYMGQALNTLAGLRVNNYHAAKQLRDALRYTDYGIQQSGGLTGGQRALMKLANANNTQNNIYKLNLETQQANNKYLIDYAGSALQYGAADAQMRQAANQYNEEYAAKSHAAKLQGKQMGVRNFMDYLNQYAKNESDRNMFNNMYDLYLDLQEIDRDALKAKQREINNNKTLARIAQHTPYTGFTPQWFLNPFNLQPLTRP